MCEQGRSAADGWVNTLQVPPQRKRPEEYPVQEAQQVSWELQGLFHLSFQSVFAWFIP
jgi:hypothetical protein